MSYLPEFGGGVNCPLTPIPNAYDCSYIEFHDYISSASELIKPAVSAKASKNKYDFSQSIGELSKKYKLYGLEETTSKKHL